MWLFFWLEFLIHRALDDASNQKKINEQFEIGIAFQTEALKYTETLNVSFSLLKLTFILIKTIMIDFQK